MLDSERDKAVIAMAGEIKRVREALESIAAALHAANQIQAAKSEREKKKS